MRVSVATVPMLTAVVLTLRVVSVVLRVSLVASMSVVLVSA